MCGIYWLVEDLMATKTFLVQFEGFPIEGSLVGVSPVMVSRSFLEWCAPEEGRNSP